MKTKEIIIYDSSYSHEKEEQTREFLFEVYTDEEDWKTSADIPDRRVMDEMDFQDEETWRTVKDGLDNMLKDRCHILTGHCGTWRGNLDGGGFIRSLKDLMTVLQHLEDIRMIDRNGHFIIEGSHHDGSDRYELKRLTHKGYLLADSHCFAIDRKLHNTLMHTNFYSALPHFAKRIYGL